MFAFRVLLAPPYACSAEREGAVLVFAFKGVKTVLTPPAPSQGYPSFCWSNPQEEASRRVPSGGTLVGALVAGATVGPALRPTRGGDTNRGGWRERDEVSHLPS